jgi:hypothetical protein
MNVPFILSRFQEVDLSEGVYDNDGPGEDISVLDELSRRDQILKDIDARIDQKKQILFSKRQFLNQTMKENEHLGLVKQGYQKYHHAILKTKQMQLDSMNMIQKHLDTLIKEGGLTDQDIEKAELDQQNVLKELDQMRKELDELIKE